MDTTDNWFEYLHNTRKLSPKVIQDAGLFVDNNWLAIPIKDIDGTVIFHKYRRAPWMDTSLPKYRYQTGSTAHLYGIDKAFHVTQVTIVEGEFDVLALRTLGYIAVSSTGGSQTFKEEWKELLKGAAITLMYDNDIAGLKGSVKVAMMLGACTFRWIPPMYGKDANDVLMNYGEEKLREIMNGVDNTLAIAIPSIEKESQIISYKKELSVILKEMSSGSIGSIFLRELIVQLSVHQSSLRAHKRRKPRETDSRLAYAKSYPIENLIKVANRKAKCPYHTEKTESFHVYANNTYHCFGCGKHGDVLDLYAHLNNLDIKNPLHFRTIIEKLCNQST